MEQRYAALLQMYGEKEEQAEELRLDLQDVKSMYRQQVIIFETFQYLMVGTFTFGGL